MKKEFAHWNYAQWGAAVDYWWAQHCPGGDPTEAACIKMAEFWMRNHRYEPGNDSCCSEHAISWINHSGVFVGWVDWDNPPTTGVLRNPPCE